MFSETAKVESAEQRAPSMARIVLKHNSGQFRDEVHHQGQVRVMAGFAQQEKGGDNIEEHKWSVKIKCSIGLCVAKESLPFTKPY